VPHPLGLITLLTDFGDRDWFVASMKGVILSINPQATIVDLSHQIPSHAVEDGAYVLKSCYQYFPAGTIHVAVVDPGVGSMRRPLVVKSSRYFFVAPDNGLLTPVFEQEGEVEVREIENKQYRLESEGRTFDGRDLFAPAAAWLTRNQPFASYGRVLGEYRTFQIAAPHWEQMALVGEVAYVDRFGNLIANLTSHHVKEVQEFTKRPNPLIRIAGHLIDGLVGSYSDGDPDAPRALMNSNGQLEIFLKGSSASARLKVGAHEVVKLS
jgi:S-adenosyl-L-methionine hydrolase (adenosine-forming)